MGLKDTWKKYEEEKEFNYSILPEALKRRGEKIIFPPKSLIVSRGDFPKSLFFIMSGTAMGIREYSDGNEYSYFQLDHTNGSIGLLELLARKESYVATIMTTSELTAIRINAEDVYEAIMSDIILLRRCTTLLADDLYKRSGNDGILYYFRGIDRVRFYLVTYYEEHVTEDASGTNVQVNAEYQDVVARIGVSVRTVGRNIQKLKECGEISSRKKKIVISKDQYHILLSHLCE